MIADDKIDILIELSGHTANNRLAVIARQPAPVQFSWLGYPGSTGITNNTYRLSDIVADPPAKQKHYTETLTYLSPLFLCYAPPPEAISLPVQREVSALTSNKGTVTEIVCINVSTQAPSLTNNWY